jgi:trimethylamine:corrinoid methyltransferase-like protein
MTARRGKRGSRRARKTEVTVTPHPGGRHNRATSPYEFFTDDTADTLIDSAIELLAESGVGFSSGSAALVYLQKGGCEFADGIVKMPREVVTESLRTSAKSVQLWDRPGERFIELDCDHTWFMPGMTTINVFDQETGERRPSNGDDLATATRVADALPNIDAVCVSCKNVARSDIHGEIEEFSIMAANTSKPLEYLCEQPEALDVVIEMAATIRGGREKLIEKPYFLHIVTPLPLNYHAVHSDQIISAVLAGVPLSVGTLPIGGASTPITTAACIVNSLATDFAAMVLAQCVRPGSFCIGSSDVCFMEPATGGIGNFAQTSLADMAMCQVRRKLDLPSFTGALGYSAARRFNQDAVAEISYSMMQAFYSRPATLDYLGSIDEGLTFSLHALMLSDDLAGLLRTMWGGIPVDAESLAMDMAKRVGPLGDYLAERHTAAHCRENLWESRYFGPNLPLSGDLKPNLDLLQRIDADLKALLESHVPLPLAPELVAELDRIREGFETAA